MNATLLYRWLTFLLAGGASVYMALYGSYAEVGGPFRYLTIWALFASFFCASRLIAQMEGRVERRFDRIIAATAALNAMVAVLYWKLFLTDPATVLRPGDARNFPMEFYLHAIGPALQIFDAVVLHRAFRKPLHSAAILVATVATYLAWIELAVQPLNQTPLGSVTSGLPYPFLNNMQTWERVMFYATNVVFGLLALAILTGISRRLRPATPAIRPDSQDTATAPPTHP